MSVFYKLLKTRGGLPKNAEFKAITVKNGTVGLKHIGWRIQQNTSLTEADVVGAVTALKEEAVEQLKLGNHVHLPGFGYFSIAVKGELYQDPRTKHYRLRNAGVRTVKFQPDKEFLEALRDVRFENMTYRMGSSETPTAKEVDEAIKALFVEKPIITVRDLRYELGVSKTYAYGLVAKLEEEGKLRNVGTYRQKLFVKGEKR